MKYLHEILPAGNFTFQAMSFGNHTDTWVLRDIPERRAVREWFSHVLSSKDRINNGEESDKPLHGP